jgi:hypothetical protein
MDVCALRVLPGRNLCVRRSPADCGQTVSGCDLGTLRVRRLRPTVGCCAVGGKKQGDVCTVDQEMHYSDNLLTLSLLMSYIQSGPKKCIHFDM